MRLVKLFDFVAVAYFWISLCAKPTHTRILFGTKFSCR